MRTATSIATLILFLSVAQAADLVVDAPVEVYDPSYDFVGVIEVGLSGIYTENDSDPFEGSAFGAYVSGAISGGSDGFLWGIDGFLEGANFETADEAPTYAALIGAHIGFGSETGRVGGFASFGAVPDNDDEGHTGYTLGVEGLATFDTISLFGQLGWAEIDNEDSTADSAGMLGPFMRIGALASFSDEFAMMADIGYGQTDHFTDEDEDGHYYALGVKAAFQLPTEFDAFITTGYEFGYYADTANDESGTNHTVKLGLALPFGDSTTAASVLNPLATSPQPYRAATYGAIVD